MVRLVDSTFVFSWTSLSRIIVFIFVYTFCLVFCTALGVKVWSQQHRYGCLRQVLERQMHCTLGFVSIRFLRYHFIRCPIKCLPNQSFVLWSLPKERHELFSFSFKITLHHSTSVHAFNIISKIESICGTYCYSTA